MTQQPLPPPDGTTVREVAGVVAAPVPATAGLLLAVRPGRVGYGNALVIADLPAARLGALRVVAGRGPGRFRAVGGDERIALLVDPAVRAVTVRGRSDRTYLVEPAAGGSRVVLRAVASGGDREEMRADLGRLLHVIADQLGVPECPRVEE
jgi:hypothetical protein